MAQVTIQDALDYCLANPEGLGAQELLGRFPQYRDELAPLLGLAVEMGSLAAPPVPTDRRATMKARIVAAATSASPAPVTSTASTATTQQPASSANGRSSAVGSSPPMSGRRAAPWFLRPVWVTAVVVVLLMGFVWSASASSLSDSPFYNVKLATESVMLNFAGSPADKTRTHLSLADARLFDLRAMQSSDKLAQAGLAFDNYAYNFDSSVALWNSIQGQEHTQLGEALYIVCVAGDTTFQGFDNALSKLPAAFQERVRKIAATVTQVTSSTSQALVKAGIDPAQVLKAVDTRLSPLLTPVAAPTPGVGTPTVIATPSPGLSLSATATLPGAIGATATGTPQHGATDTSVPGVGTPGVSVGTPSVSPPPGTSTPGTGAPGAPSATVMPVSGTETPGPPVPSGTPTIRTATTPTPTSTTLGATPGSTATATVVGGSPGPISTLTAVSGSRTPITTATASPKTTLTATATSAAKIIPSSTPTLTPTLMPAPCQSGAVCTPTTTPTSTPSSNSLVLSTGTPTPVGPLTPSLIRTPGKALETPAFAATDTPINLPSATITVPPTGEYINSGSGHGNGKAHP